MQRRGVAASVLAAALALTGLVACGDEEPGVDEPAREGLAIPIDGLDYNVFITRQLNPEIQPDVALVPEEEPKEGSALYGVFIQACNSSDEPHEMVDDFKIKDNQGETFEPEELPEENAFAYRARTLEPDQCVPEPGSFNQQGPTGASLVVFELPLPATENRPLELEVEGSEETKTFELDI